MRIIGLGTPLLIAMKVLIISAILLVVAACVLAAMLYVLNVSPLARPHGVPPQARNLGNFITPTYWHWCEEANGVRKCETYTRSGGFPLYSGRYMPVIPADVSRIAQIDRVRFPEAAVITDNLRMKTIFYGGYNWPLVERVALSGARGSLSYRFVLPDCLEAISGSDLEGFLQQAQRWRDESDEIYLAELSALFATIDVELRTDTDQVLYLSDAVAGARGTAPVPQPRFCSGWIYLNSPSSAETN